MSNDIAKVLGNRAAVLVVKYPNRIIRHSGILTIHEGTPYVFHCDDIKKNRYGGSIVYESLESFLMGRSLKKATIVDVPFSEIQAYSYLNRHKSYSKFFYNCEMYISKLVTGKKESPQLKKYLTIGASAMLMPFIL